jgi:hypothetical protein
VVAGAWLAVPGARLGCCILHPVEAWCLVACPLAFGAMAVDATWPITKGKQGMGTEGAAWRLGGMRSTTPGVC